MSGESVTALCMCCGIGVTILQGDPPICPHHAMAFSDDWARSNKILCDFLHRGVEPPANNVKLDLTPLEEQPVYVEAFFDS